MAEQEPKPPSGDNPAMWLKQLWRFFSSVRLALALILIIAALGLLDAFTNVKVVGSVFFAIPAIALMVNILICTLNRWNTLKLAIRGGAIMPPDAFFDTGTVISGLHYPAKETSAAAEKVLAGRGYRIRKDAGNGLYIAGDKNRYFRLGTYLTHFSLILFVAAFLAGAQFGFHDTQFTVTEGTAGDVGHGTGLSLELVSFVYEQYDNGTPKDYRSQVVLYENGKPVQEALVRVNHPLSYKGIRFYQTYFGTSAASLLITNDNGETVFDGGIPVTAIPDSPQYFQGYMEIEGQGFEVVVMGSSDPADTMIPAGTIGLGLIKDGLQIGPELLQENAPFTMEGYEFTFREMLNYSGFQVIRDPANAFIWIASGLFIIGLCAIFYFTYRQVWVRCREDETGTTVVIVMHSRPNFTTALELKNLQKDITDRLASSQNKN